MRLRVSHILAVAACLLLPAGARGQATEPAPVPPAIAAPPGRVVVGAFINDVQSIDLKLHSYAVDIYIWFRWRDPALDSPADSMEFVNPSELWGHARTTSYEATVETPAGDRYQVVRVQGRFSKKLPLYNYPFDRQTLTVMFEDTKRDVRDLVFEPDARGVTVNPDLVLPGFRFGQPRLVVAPFHYPTDFGDPRDSKANVYSRVTVELPISRPTATYAIKLLLPVLCVVLCAGLMLVLRATWVDARIGIGITALLTIVALQITTNDDLPNVDYLVLMDKVYILAYVYVIAGLGVVVHTTRAVDRGQDLAETERLHRKALYVLSGVFVAAFVSVVVHAIVVG